MKAIEQPTEGIMRILGGDPTAPNVEHGDFYGGKHFRTPARTTFERSLACAYFPIKKKSVDSLWQIVSIWSFITEVRNISSWKTPYTFAALVCLGARNPIASRLPSESAKSATSLQQQIASK
jgi:hypothetical protein